jgi:hypothetical protein
VHGYKLLEAGDGEQALRLRDPGSGRELTLKGFNRPLKTFNLMCVK